MYLRCAFILTFLCCFPLAANCESGEAKPMTVCQLLKNLDRYRGKVVVVRGVWTYSREVTALYAEDCGKSIRYRGLQWPPAFDVVTPEAADPESGPVAFKADASSLTKLAAIYKEHPAKPTMKVEATVVGLLVVRNSYVVSHPDRQDHGGGFGAFGLFPAQIVVKEFRDFGVPHE